VKISQAGIDLIKHFEGCALQSYRCPSNVSTIGYGHTHDVKDDETCTEEEAENLLVEDLVEFEGYVNNLVTVPLEQNQFDAIVSWTFNLGPTNLGESTLLTRLNDKAFWDVPFQIKRWTRSNGKVLEGLVKRREAEATLFKKQLTEN